MDKAKLRKSWAHPNCASISIVDLDYRRIKGFRSTKYLKSKVAYARYFIEDFLPDVDKVIYLDSDLIVLRDLCEANQIDLHGATAGVVLDISTRANGGQIELCKKLGIADPSCYFNSGFMVIDMNAWKRDRVKDELIAVSNDLFDKLDAQDQSALNIVLENRTKILDVLWNTVQYEADATFSNGIVHLIGTVKPWHFDFQHHFKDLFFEYLDRTAYAGMRPPSPGSVGALRTLIERELPTLDMISGKMRRLLSVNSTTRQTKPGIETGAIKAAEVLRG